MNQEYIERHGKWAAYDVSADDPWEKIVDTVTISAELTCMAMGDTLSIYFDRYRIYIEVASDELLVNLEPTGIQPNDWFTKDFDGYSFT